VFCLSLDQTFMSLLDYLTMMEGLVCCK